MSSSQRAKGALNSGVDVLRKSWSRTMETKMLELRVNKRRHLCNRSCNCNVVINENVLFSQR